MSVHKYKQVCMQMCKHMETGSWCLVVTFLWNFYCNYFVCVYAMCTCYRCTLLCLSGLQIHISVSGWITDARYCVWIADTQCCVYPDYTHTLLSPAGSQIHTSVSGWIADTHYCVWLYSVLRIPNFSCLWTKCFTHGISAFLIHRIFHRTICLSFNARGPERPVGNLKMKYSTEFSSLTRAHIFTWKDKQKHSFQKHGWIIHIRKDNGSSGSGRGIIQAAQRCPHFQGRKQVFVWPHCPESTGCAKLPRDMAFPSFLSATLPGAPPSVLLQESTFN